MTSETSARLSNSQRVRVLWFETELLIINKFNKLFQY